MIRSMTAFAAREGQTAWGVLSWELRSVNHRHLEVMTRLPDDFRVLEPQIREALAKRLTRGRVECQLRFQSSEAVAERVTLNKSLAKQLVQASREVEGLLDKSSPLSPIDILRWPGVLESAEADLEQLRSAAMSLLEEALDDFVSTRLREGRKLYELIAQRCDGIAGQVAQVKQRLPEIRGRFREKLMGKLEEIKTQVDSARLEQEMVFYAQRMDVDEETDRLLAHLGEVKRVLNQDEPAGRRLDFLMQELNREANTLGSKSVDIETTRASVEIKVLIEQMREQVQNVE